MQDDFTKTVIRAVSLEGGGFMLECPPGAHRAGNLPLSWRGESVLFGWEPSELVVADNRSSASAAEGFKHTARRLEADDAAIAVGWLSYDLGGFIERSAASKKPPDSMPVLLFGIYSRYYQYDPSTKAIFVCRKNDRRPASRLDLDEIAARASLALAHNDAAAASTPVSDFSRQSYMEAVARAREYILSGDIFEVNLSQCFRTRFAGPSWQLYERLRRHNPAPYAAYLTSPHGDVLSSSPELFLSVTDAAVITRPIKGTIARGRTAISDAAAAEALASSEKDNAELAMIIDLERNDLGRVCSYGSVKVVERARVETFSRVHHLVSTVEGRLKRGVDLWQLMRATFPGGSITGAPKVRAMQIIDELEPCRRGVYTGSVGYLLPGGRAELNIAIRTMVFRDGDVSLQVGGAVTADSDPLAEYEETLAKALGMVDALGRQGIEGKGDGETTCPRKHMRF